tara:strand:+ start:2597 stop:2854 length:258 start_codon:yes stop_codon:yes gene_type:complete
MDITQNLIRLYQNFVYLCTLKTINQNKNTMKKLIVLDFTTAEVHIYPYDENIWECPEDFADENGNLILNSNCQWMVVDELKLQIH